MWIMLIFIHIDRHPRKQETVCNVLQRHAGYPQIWIKSFEGLLVLSHFACRINICEDF